MKNILVIGGSYFAGKIFIEELIKRKEYLIYALNRGNRPLGMDGVKEIVCDRQNPGQLKSSIPPVKWDAVIDFCAYTPDDIKILFSALSGHSVRHYVYISTTSIYKETMALPVKEEAPMLEGPQPELGPSYADYAYNKLLGEREVIELSGKTGIPYTFLRPAIIYGKYNYAPRESYFFDLILQGKTVVLPANRLALFSFVSVWDVARAIIECIGNEKTCNKAFNLAAGELVSYYRLIEVLKDITGEMIATKAVSVKEIDQRRIPLPFPLDSHLIYSGILIKDVLNFEYTPFIEGMKKTYECYTEGLKSMHE